MALMQITIIPLGTGTPGVGDYVADCQRFLERKGLPFKLNDMGTLIQGEPGELLALAAEMHKLPFLKDARRVVTQITLDERTDKEISIGDKTAAVRARLEKTTGSPRRPRTR